MYVAIQPDPSIPQSIWGRIGDLGLATAAESAMSQSESLLSSRICSVVRAHKLALLSFSSSPADYGYPEHELGLHG